MESSTAADAWSTTWPIAQWRDQTLWEVVIDKWGTQADQPNTGRTSITITDLHPAISQRLSQPSFARDLKQRIASTYALFLKAGIEISINGQPVEPALPILATAPLAPARRQWTSDGVEVLLIAGVSPIDDQAPRGWYVFCNGRMVLEADKSAETGWGDVLPQFRSKYNHFLGYVYFRSSDVRLLPWRTTKQGVERESPVYQQALGEMRVQARPVLNYLNDLYPSDSQADPALERAWLQQAGTVLITDLPTGDRAFEYAPRRRQARQDISIQYRRLKTDVERIRRYLDDPSLSATSIGGLTFDYYLEQIDD
jgi:hypothetical protein